MKKIAFIINILLFSSIIYADEKLTKQDIIMLDKKTNKLFNNSITSIKLAHIYKFNQILRDQKYNGKNFYITGNVDKILKLDNGMPLICLEGNVFAGIVENKHPLAAYVRKDVGLDLNFDSLDLGKIHDGNSILMYCNGFNVKGDMPILKCIVLSYKS